MNDHTVSASLMRAMPDFPAITAIITTHNRCDAALAAAASVLDQDPAVAELFVCDDGSSDETPERFAEWAAREPRLRYHRFSTPQGGPGAGRNHGIAHAAGDWIAFLDDDDLWLPGKLAVQGAHLDDHHDVVATNAWRSSGARYFPELDAPYEPTRRQLLHVNPLIISSVVARRTLLQRIGGFADLPWLRRGPLDFHTWLRLSDVGARFLVLPDAVVRYDDPPGDRLSSSPLRIRRALVRIAWERWMRHPADRDLAEAAVRHLADGALESAETLWGRLERPHRPG
jgi:glycosyltransferase involved in cell wall biosynthesis